MTEEGAKKVEAWFTDYALAFRDNGKLPWSLQRKFDHSFRVAEEARGVAEEMGWGAERVELGRAAGLLHDVGRFSQHAEFKSFHDAVTVDHGERGFSILQPETEPFACLSDGAREQILLAVRWHNKRTVPDFGEEKSLMLKLIRDADKLDIFSEMQRIVRENAIDEFLEAFPHLSREGEVSSDLLEQFEKTGSCLYQDLRTFADLCLIQLSWLNQFNYAASSARVLARGVVDDIAKAMPDSKLARSLIKRAREHLAAHSCF